MYTVLGQDDFSGGFTRKRDAIAEAKRWVVSGDDTHVVVREDKTEVDVYVCWSDGYTVYEAISPKELGRFTPSGFAEYK